MAFTNLHRKLRSRIWLGILSFVLILAASPAYAADTPAPADTDVIVSTTPMELEAEDGGAHGDLAVAPELGAADRKSVV